MSSAVATAPIQSVATPKKKDKSKKRDKERSEKKSSKKRQREDDSLAVRTADDREESLSKRARTSPASQRTAISTQKQGTKDWSKSAAALNNGRTTLHEQTMSFYLPISPISLRHPLKGLCAEHLSRLILTFYPPLDGIVLSYRDVKLTSHPPTSSNDLSRREGNIIALAEQIDEYAPSFIWLTATFLLLRPEKGVWLDAVVNLQNESHLGLIVWNLFTASVPREHLPNDWRWRDVTPGTATKHAEGEDEWGTDEQGYFLDGEGKRLPRQISVRVRDFDASPSLEGDRGFISLEGTLLTVEEEERLEKEELEKEKLRDGERADRRKEVQVVGVLSEGGLGAGDNQHAANGTRAEGGRGKHRTAY